MQKRGVWAIIFGIENLGGSRIQKEGNERILNRKICEE
jgi:hypothetical protein